MIRQGKSFDFFQLLHMIERLVSDTVQLGGPGPAREEPIRVRPQLDFSFPPGDIAEVAWRDAADGNGRLRITATFMGLYGSSSPLPAHFTEALFSSDEGAQRVREFIDLFQHRVYCLLYRVWKKYRYYATFHADGSDPISQVVRGYLGIATPKLDESIGLNPVRIFRYAGMFSQRPRCGAGLTGLMSDFFGGIRFDLRECVGRWLRIQPNDQNVLGRDNCTLGRDVLLGERIFDSSGKFRMKVGPVGFDDFVRFLPPGDAAADLAALTRFYCDDPLDFDKEVTLRGEQVPQTPLGVAGENGMLGRLAWTTWLKSEPCGDKSVIFDAVRERAKEQKHSEPVRAAPEPDDSPVAAPVVEDEVWG